MHHVRRYPRCLWLQHGGVPERLRPRDDLRRLLAAAAEAIHLFMACSGCTWAGHSHQSACGGPVSMSPEPGGAQVHAMPMPRKYAAMLHFLTRSFWRAHGSLNLEHSSVVLAFRLLNVPRHIANMQLHTGNA